MRDGEYDIEIKDSDSQRKEVRLLSKGQSDLPIDCLLISEATSPHAVGYFLITCLNRKITSRYIYAQSDIHRAFIMCLIRFSHSYCEYHRTAISESSFTITLVLSLLCFLFKEFYIFKARTIII